MNSKFKTNLSIYEVKMAKIFGYRDKYGKVKFKLNNRLLQNVSDCDFTLSPTIDHTSNCPPTNGNYLR